MASRDPADEDLPALLDDLDRTLTALRDELREADDPSRQRAETAGDSRLGDERGRRRGTRPRPPSLSELFRFTEQYTLPTLIATLETAIQSLELLRGMLRLADPERSAFERSDRARGSSSVRLSDGVAGVGRGAVSGVERALSELQTALSESDLPEEQSSRELLEDARRLSAEVSTRLAETSRESDAERYGYRRDESSQGGDDSLDRGVSESGGVEIDVMDERDRRERGSHERESAATDEERTSDGERTDETSADAPEVDVEAELASIKEDVEPREERSEENDGETPATATSADTADDDEDEVSES
ncbi:hypothetical protein D3D02_02525 [Halobellus sp. Atlit-38R]|jgi:hypothetical protein|uniref:DUF7547 family protein n=1 Tax=Halobellus sp. Atlit-38R TaxID=2282131 RepID=UPI000EF17635|nr:hypothetical protein [Halobellus sp. Atlit-38R]RLM94877.1 hypothetical protein D3D02_02525 [Halobellus sp. Atlit-38R]